jgi:biopolymer transport protein ExbB/TolQ
MLIRHFLQYNSMISSQYLISNYVWHLSFFHSHSSQQIKEKLESYSHQNFARRFYEKSEEKEKRNETDGGDTEEEEEEEEEKEWKIMTNNDMVPKGNISIELIEKKLKEKKLINGKEFIKKYQRTSLVSSQRKKKKSIHNSPTATATTADDLVCQERPFDMKSFFLKKLWNEIEDSKMNSKE